MAGRDDDPRRREADLLARDAAEDARAAETDPPGSDAAGSELPRRGPATATLILIGLVIAVLFFLAGIEVQKLLG